MRHAAAVLVAVAALAACGGGGGTTGPPLSRSQLVTKVNAECRQLMQASNDLASAQDPSFIGPKVAQYMKRAASELRTRVEHIAALHAPGSVSSDVDRFVSTLTRYADGLDALAGRIHTDENYSDLLNRSTAQVDALNKLSSQANTIAAKLGFDACAT